MILAISCIYNGHSHAETDIKTESVSTVIPISEVKWEQLNPARGDKSPEAGTLWGDRKLPVPTGFLVKFVDGFSSPPHIHNVSYRGIVISGLIHNDDPDAAKMWMPTGSFWTQPERKAHITAAKGSTNIAYIEIEEGPYLVRSVKEAFNSMENPVNVDISNVVWLDASDIQWMSQSEKVNPANKGVEVAFLWGNPKINQLNGTLIKLPAGFIGALHSDSSSFRGVVIQGEIKYGISNGRNTRLLKPGSYFGSSGEFAHRILSSDSGKESLIYIRTKGRYSILSD